MARYDPIASDVESKGTDKEVSKWKRLRSEVRQRVKELNLGNLGKDRDDESE